MEPVKDNEHPITAYCRACGRGLAKETTLNYQGTVYCEEHYPKTASEWSTTSAPPNVPPRSAATPDSGASPGLAFLLGLIPGVGAIYNGQYAKGFVHVLVAGLLFSLAGNESGPMEPLFNTFIPVWFFYMAFEAYHTAKKRMAGERVDEFSSVFPAAGSGRGLPVLPLLLIALGVLFLFNNLGILSIRQFMPYAGPLFLIGLGSYLLYARVRANATVSETSHEKN